MGGEGGGGLVVAGSRALKLLLNLLVIVKIVKQVKRENRQKYLQ